MLKKNIFQSLGISTIIILASSMLISCKQECEIPNQDAQKESVQLNDSIFNRVFGIKSCSPRKLVLRLPVNTNLETENQREAVKSKDYTPKITNYVTFSSEYKTFKISRIDEYKDGLRYTNKDTCLAWKWSKDDKQESTLHLSMERNLKIRDPNIKSVIFLISLPIEIKEAGVDITLDRYAWDKETSKVGAINYFNFNKKYPNLRSLLRQRDKGRLDAPDVFNEGKPINDEIKEEIFRINNIGGLHLEREFEQLIKSKYEKTYFDTLDSPPCEIPKDLNNL